MKKIFILLFSLKISLIFGQTDTLKTNYLQEVVISASRLLESTQKSPVSIEVLNLKTAQNSAAPSYFDAIENIKGVQLITPSLGFKVYNTRGFTNPTNVRFIQLVDGIDNQAPHIGAPIANAIAPSDLDLQRVEMVPGVAAALYGLNALNGMVNIISLNPFDSEGLTFQQKTGVNHLNDSNVSAKVFSETSIRYAKKISQRWAFKLNANYQNGYDWIADNHNDLNATANSSLNIAGGEHINPAYDGVNGYGNESSNRRTLTLDGKKIVVARTGYTENEVTDYTLSNWKIDGALHFRPKAGIEAVYFVKYSLLDNVYQRTNRFRLQNYNLFQQGFSLKSGLLQVNAYMTHENTGSSYNIRSMAENIDKNFKSDDNWYKDFSTQYISSTKAGTPMIEALNIARLFADKGRPQPHSEEFNALVKQLGDINNWDIGAALRVQTYLYNVDGQFNLSKYLNRKSSSGIQVLTGFDLRNYVVIPDGNYFINPTETSKNLNYSKLGGFVDASKSVLNNRLKLGATLRLDKNQYFEPKLNPRLSMVYSFNEVNHLRVSYQSGYRFPSLFEAFSNVNSGGVKRVGGLKIMSDGIFENSYFRSSIDAFQTTINNDVNTNGLTTAAAIEKNKGLLQKNDYTYLHPEHVKSLELGYKTALLSDRLVLDADFYYSVYDGFIAQVEANIAKGKNIDSLGIYFSDKKYQERYRLWTNSKTKVYNYGASLGAKLLLGKNFITSTNVSFAELDRKDFGDGLEEAFNTPKWIVNYSFGSNRLIKNFGFNTAFKWQSSFLWQSSLASGTVPAYSSLDAQISYSLPHQNISLKLGGTNILNNYYYNFLAGPSVGGFYYLTVKYNVNP